MQPKSHLRQRHGSDALRLDLQSEDHPRRQYPSSSDSSPGPPHSSSSSTNNTSPEIASSYPKSPVWDDGSGNSNSKRVIRSSSVRIARYEGHAEQFAGNTMSHASPSQHSSIRPHAASLSSLSIDAYSRALPSGASTPSLDSARLNRHHIVSYPPGPPTWSNMPCKDQLAILALSRFVDFFQMASLQTYMVHQLKSFDPTLPSLVISHQAGVLQGAFTASQIVTSILWGRAADRPGVGRKLVLMIGLVGTAVSMLGVGFSSNYHQAVFWRVLGGAINGTVGAARTMVAETVDKRWHPRAFLLLPAAFNVANVLGPILGGLLVEPLSSYPRLLGPGSPFGGSTGVQWMKQYPYALANLLSAVLLVAEAVLVHLYLRETLKGFRKVGLTGLIAYVQDAWDQLRGFRLQSTRMFTERRALKRGLLSTREDASIELDRVGLTVDQVLDANEKGQPRPVQRLPFRRIWTSNVLWTLLTIAIFDFHMGAFNNLWTLFLSTNRTFVPSPDNNSRLVDTPSMAHKGHDDNKDNIGGYGYVIRRFLGRALRRSAFDTHHVTRSVFKFGGGLAFPPTTIGFAMAIIGFVGVTLQFLLYPWANARFGLMRCFRLSLFFFPLAYFLAPYIALLPSTSASPQPASGFWVWLGISIVITVQVAARTFALPASIILLNNSSPHPSVLATIHGLGQATSATFRTLGPILSGSWYGTWYERGVVGMSWWFVAAISALGCVASYYVRNGSGHEILLPGEEGRSDFPMATVELRHASSGGSVRGYGRSGPVGPDDDFENDGRGGRPVSRS